MSIKDILAAIYIFKKYVPVENPIFHAEHDLLTGPSVDDMEGLSEEDKKDLEDLNWFIGDYDCWAHYCSC